MNIPTNITTDTHKITAWYELDPGCNEILVDTNGHTLEEITKDLLDFFNSMDETAEIFELDSAIDESGNSEEVTIKLNGKLHKEILVGAQDPENLQNVIVVIHAEEK